MSRPQICFVTSEVAPYAKTGGLGDVCAALPKALARLGHRVRVFLPLYTSARKAAGAAEVVETARDVPVTLGDGAYTFTLRRTTLQDSEAELYLIDCPALYDRATIYTEDPDEHRRFLLLSRAALEGCRRLRWAPDILHVHDWHASFLPLHLHTVDRWDRLFDGTKTVLTIHNLGHQGAFSSAILEDTWMGGSAHLLDRDDLAAGRINFLKTGILYADAITTVSPTYAQEIQTPEHGMGLDPYLRGRSGSLVGILNGVDYNEWSPRSDRHIPFHYSPASFWRKEKNKAELLSAMGLSYSPRVPVLGIVTRLSAQKGLDLVEHALPGILRTRDIRFVALGSGEPRYAEMLRRMQEAFPGKVTFYDGFQEPLAHLIEAGSDIFLMPSRYEPCGLNQMYSLKYGTVPIVRRTGGLADTVEPYDPRTGRGTGFVFEHYTPEGLRWAIELALEAFRDHEAWVRLGLAGMEKDFSWEKQAGEYVQLYARVGSGATAREGVPG
ncbi:MAG TPA: glycogen synthase GlgA [Candidatus Eisenbacteria bacterium]|nr:glycogen synthase GlgA [Candidatus Eisenbacteria bacterium]